MITAPTIPVTEFAALAHRIGITQTDRTLAMTGKLVRVSVQRHDYYLLADVIACAPGPRYPLIAAERADLADRDHTITVERVDPATAQAWAPVVTRWRPLIGRRAVVERSHGHLGKVCAIEDVDGVGAIVITAISTARTYGARYVPAEGAS